MNNDQKLAKLIRIRNSREDMDVPEAITLDIIQRILFQEGDVDFVRFVDIMKVHKNVIDEILQWMQGEHLIEVAKTGSFGRMSYTFRLTEAGFNRAKVSAERSQYIGPVPVPVDSYNEAVELQTDVGQTQKISQNQIKQALRHLILPEGFDRRVGPALNSGTSLFLYGPPGNGKTTIAQIIGMLLAGTEPIRLPYALILGGQIIKIYDPLIHIPVIIEKDEDAPVQFKKIDERWGLFRRPIVMVGGELTMDSLDLRFDPVAMFYEAPLQMKANGGMLLIDDFGRQAMRPDVLLNRWVVPLENNFDFFKLLSGLSFKVPFRQLIVFSTNLDPADLVDDAFLRRIQMKVEVGSPDERMFYQIFVKMCQSMNVPFDKDSFVHLLDTWYRKTGRVLQSVHPRDILRVSIAICEYIGTEPKLTPDIIDEACENYFV